MFQWLKHLFIEEYDDYYYTVLSKYKKGKLVNKDDEYILDELASVGLVRVHEEVEPEFGTGYLSYHRTAKCTGLGRNILKYMRD